MSCPLSLQLLGESCHVAPAKAPTRAANLVSILSICLSCILHPDYRLSVPPFCCADTPRRWREPKLPKLCGLHGVTPLGRLATHPFNSAIALAGLRKAGAGGNISGVSQGGARGSSAQSDSRHMSPRMTAWAVIRGQTESGAGVGAADDRLAAGACVQWTRRRRQELACWKGIPET